MKRRISEGKAIAEQSRRPEEGLRGRVAVVTGAGRRAGIGVAICRALARRGADIFFTQWGAYDRGPGIGEDPDGPVALRQELRSLGVRAEHAEADLSLPESPARVLEEATERLGTPSILVNNAAHSARDGFENLDATTLDAHYVVNLRATALLSVEFARRYPGGPGGRIFSMTSGQENGPMPGELAYAATKGAVAAFTRSLAAEVGPKGITVNAVNPGPTDTGWMDEGLKRELTPRFPLGRIGLPKDAARLVAWLATDEAEWITGQVIHSEGGSLNPLGLQEERPVRLVRKPVALPAGGLPYAPSPSLREKVRVPRGMAILTVWLHALLTDGAREVLLERVTAG